ncbi:MAG: C_GCAxxG_C_C family protein [Phycisphaerales bacterium]|nr:MAG: C_GCAxxG_C_C family protein [Phycisphaerales bacterium]
MSKVQDAVSAFESGFNCSRAIVRTYGPDYGLSVLDAIRVSCGFGGGMRRGDVCGAVTGALMVLGLRFGAQDGSDTSAKAGVYSKLAEFYCQFESRCDSVACRDLLGCDISTPEGMEQATSNNLFKTVCPKMVQAAAEILEDMC